MPITNDRGPETFPESVERGNEIAAYYKSLGLDGPAPPYDEAQLPKILAPLRQKREAEHDVEPERATRAIVEDPDSTIDAGSLDD